MSKSVKLSCQIVKRYGLGLSLITTPATIFETTVS